MEMFDQIHYRTLTKWAIALVVLGFLMQVSLVFTSKESLAHRPFEEDTFYVMSLTRELAKGNFNLIDSEQALSGIQPGGVIYVAAHLIAGFDKWQALRWARIIDLLGSCLAAFLIYRIGKISLVGIKPEFIQPLSLLSSGLWMVSYQVFRINLNGYETIIAICAVLLVTIVYLSCWKTLRFGSLISDFKFGVYLGLMILCRVDTGFLAASIALWHILFYPDRFEKRLLSVLTWMIIAITITAPWWITNWVIDQSIMPLSGKATMLQINLHGYWSTISSNIGHLLQVVEEIPFISPYVPFEWYDNVALHILRLTALTGVIVVLLKAKSDFRSVLSKMDWRPWGAFALFAIMIVMYYTFIHGGSWHIRRYLHPLRCIFFIWAGLYVFLVAYAMSKALWTHVNGKIILQVLLVGISLISVVQHYLTYNKTDSNAFMSAVHYLETKHPGARIGAFQSGTLGYFLPNVTNLDGKINPKAYRAASAGKTLSYILSSDIEFVCDWPAIVSLYCDSTEFSFYYVKEAEVGTTTIWRRRDFPQKNM